MKAPTIQLIKNNNEEPYVLIKGNFNFELGKTEYDPEHLMPLKPITFYWTPEMAQDIIKCTDESNVLELFAEKLKLDFITFVHKMTDQAPWATEPMSAEIPENAEILMAALLDTGLMEEGFKVVETAVIPAKLIGVKYEWVDEKHKILKKIIPNTSFALTWKNAENEPPKEVGRYWCIVKEITDLGVSYYQWNCAYNPNDIPRWTSNELKGTVIWWTELAPRPF